MRILMCLILFSGMLGVAQAMELTVKNLDQIKLGCSNPSAVNNQLAPEEIKLTCSEVITTWLASMNGVLPLAKSDLMQTSATTDKPNVGSATEVTNIPLADYPADCPKYNEVKLTASAIYDLTCEQVSVITNLATYCKAQFDQEMAANPGFYTITPTGNVKDTCANSVPVSPPVRRGNR
jgi:hypothetical protein